jgi:hypothetical protein
MEPGNSGCFQPLENDSLSVMAGLDPRLSGLELAYGEAHLTLILDDWRWRIEEVVDWPAVHKVCPDQSGEDNWTGNGFLNGLGQAQEQESDQGDGNLDTYGILGSADKTGNSEGLLDPTEEQLDGPASTIEIGYFLGTGIEIVRQDAQHLSGFGHNADLANRVPHRVLSASGLSCRKEANAIGENVAV